MKTIFYLLMFAALAISFTVPVSSVTAAGLCSSAAENDCASAGRVCDPNTGACVSSSYVTPGSSGGIDPTYLQGYKTSIIGIINGMLVPVLVAIAFITFLWGVYRYFILGAESDTERATGRQFVLWGIIGFVVILSMWALVNIVSGTLGLQVGNTAPRPPTI